MYIALDIHYSSRREIDGVADKFILVEMYKVGK